jgi:hypothetical protein
MTNNRQLIVDNGSKSFNSIDPCICSVKSEIEKFFIQFFLFRKDYKIIRRFQFLTQKFSY